MPEQDQLPRSRAQAAGIPTLAPRLIAAFALGLSCTHKTEAGDVAQVRRMLYDPHLDAQGNYIVTPGELVRSMSQPGAAARWLGASVHLSGMVVHVGTAEEGRVRGLNDGKAFIMIADSASDPANRSVSSPVAVCELDSSAVPSIAEGDSVEADGEVSGVAGRPRPISTALRSQRIERRPSEGLLQHPIRSLVLEVPAVERRLEVVYMAKNST